MAATRSPSWRPVYPDAPLREVARLLLDKGISAVPVVDDNGTPIGMVSEGDLIRPDRAHTTGLLITSRAFIGICSSGVSRSQRLK